MVSVIRLPASGAIVLTRMFRLCPSLALQRRKKKMRKERIEREKRKEKRE